MKLFIFNLLVVMLLLHPFFVSASATNSAKFVSDNIPTLSDILPQDFKVSVVTQSFGVFNATLRVQSSPNFKGRFYGELIPNGDLLLPMTERKEKNTVTTIPHFSRPRELVDDELSGLTATMGTTSEAKGSKALPINRERPTLLAFDGVIHNFPFKQRPSMEVTAFYLPEDPEALRKEFDAIQEGIAQPTATTELLFRPTRPGMTSVMLSDFPMFARIASAILNIPGDSPTQSTRKGSIILNFFSEHEFTMDLRLPRSLFKDGSSTQEEGEEERVWVHGYVPLSPKLSPRQVVERPWWVGPSMILVVVITFIFQIFIGIYEGKQKIQNQRNQKGAVTSAEKKTN